MHEVEQAYHDVRYDAERNEDILGFVLTGSRGRGFGNRWSDFDFAIFVADDALAKYEETYRSLPSGTHLYIFTLDSFDAYAAWGSGLEYNRYMWAHLTVEFDRTAGRIQQLLEEKSRVPTEAVTAYIRYSLSWFVHQAYHSLKSHRVGNTIGHRLEAAEMVRPFLQAIFASHDRRLVPYYKYLRWELEHHPLDRLTLSTDALLDCLLQVLEHGEHQAQQVLLEEARQLFADTEFADIFAQYNTRLALNYPTLVEDQLVFE